MQKCPLEEYIGVLGTIHHGKLFFSTKKAARRLIIRHHALSARRECSRDPNRREYPKVNYACVVIALGSVKKQMGDECQIQYWKKTYLKFGAERVRL